MGPISPKQESEFVSDVEGLTKEFFLPVGIGGTEANFHYAAKLLNSGAEKIVVRSALIDKPMELAEFVGQFGRQAVVASLDLSYAPESKESLFVHFNKGRVLPAEEAFSFFDPSLFGELLIQSVTRDGSGQGLDLDLLQNPFLKTIRCPIILGGGMGKPLHLVEGLQQRRVSAVATSNLLAFFGNGLHEARRLGLSHGVDLSLGNFKENKLDCG